MRIFAGAVPLDNYERERRFVLQNLITFFIPIIANMFRFSKALSVLALAVLATTTGFAQKGKKGGGDKGKEAVVDSLSYSYGLIMGKEFQNMFQMNNLNINKEEFLKALSLSLNNQDDKLLMNDAAARNFLDEYSRKMQEEEMKQAQRGSEEKMKAEAEWFAKNVDNKPGIKKTASGLRYEILKEGTGAKPTLQNQVTTHYHGTFTDGKVFDSSVQRGEPATFPVGGVIQGWIEILQLMPAGSKWRVYIPYELAYGAQGAGGVIPPYSTLIFEIELISIQ